jgi:nucleoside-diphosphate-sugar epimerase
MRDAANKPESGIHCPDGDAIAKDILDRAERPDQPCAITDQEGLPWMWSPSDARDTARACVCALDHPAAVGEAFNAPIYRALTFPEVATYLSEKRGIPPLKVEVPVQWIYWSDNTKARTLIGYEPQCTLENIFDTALADEAGEPADVISA